ncbi:ADP-ribosylglycohydrolase family protein [Microvirga zambiensis]|uniref:ADP-ribosylglycohydrolase family protein n=1 Tax=Microvirga zambiensis TaxID=1402137 RepID=UPI00191D4680|nr:ADP-ribosylglycohydrolase family protein [Microvirga zambiensis]
MPSILRIAKIPVGNAGGMLGVTFAPGKKQVSAYSGTHDRDLHQDLDVVAAWGAAAVVTLVTEQELAELRIQTLGDEVRARFMEWHHLPIADYHAPDAAFEAVWPDTSKRLRTLLEAGARVLVHCKGGLGRAGTIAARLLVEMGADPEQAICDVRAARSPDAIENRAQEDWVRRGKAADCEVDTGLHAIRDRAIGALVGLAVGDALGTTLEFSRKPPKAVLHDMVGGGPFGLRPGQWTDDTAMALALADSLTVHPDLDAHDLMERFVAWNRDGTYSCTGACFDIGITTAEALRCFEKTGDPFAGSTDPDKAGNGSMMRLAPVVIRHWSDRNTLLRVARDQSRTTHAAAEAVNACETLALILADAIAGRSMPEIVAGAASRVKGFRPGQPRDEVRGTGYVVASLHAAIWAVSRTTSFETAVLLAANLGEDADTTAAVAGQIAGALYGLSGIPEHWLAQLAWGARIQGMAQALFEASTLAAAA